MCNKFDTNISAKSKPYSKMLKHVILKPRWVSIVKKLGIKSLVTLSLNSLTTPPPRQPTVSQSSKSERRTHGN